MKCLEAKGKSAKASGMLTEQSAAVKEVRRKIGQEATIKRLGARPDSSGTRLLDEC
jgi:hypothetical protein